jgi:hypothetical protein
MPWKLDELLAYAELVGPREPVVVDYPFFHGGIDGLDVGDLLLPPAVTGYLRPQEMSKQAGMHIHGLNYKKSYDRSMVYATRKLGLAYSHAMGYSNFAIACESTPTTGAVYEVEPYNANTMELDKSSFAGCCKDNPHPSWVPCMIKAKQLRIVRVVDRGVMDEQTDAWHSNMMSLRLVYATWRLSNAIS